ncbi:MAG: hypothetical protein E6J73_12540 [Deltaproteobacteria bacterium]|jgi:uncharacterized protein YjiS (DUF1127 family)|nr:MAG: hypothetical protein E6J73_12540 [Deltaproteobacteria bacterium]
METSKSYPQQLRSIGQSLEAQRIQIFELTCHDDQFVVKGEPEKEASMLAALRHWQQRRRRSDGLNASLTFTSQDIDQLERQGRSQRAQPNRLPDFYSLPNTLRTVGHYLELKGSELLEMQKRQLSLTLLSRNKDGHPEIEERSIASFYNLFLRLHDKRGKPQNR